MLINFVSLLLLKLSTTCFREGLLEIKGVGVGGGGKFLMHDFFFKKPACLQEFFSRGYFNVNRLVVQLKKFIQPLLQKHVVGKNTARDI